MTKIMKYGKKFIDPIVLHDKLCQQAKAIMKKKNHDYRGGSGDPYKNFRGSEQFDIDPIIGILLRMQDKMMRIQTFVEKGELLVRDESVNDSLYDIVNYAVLIGGLVDEAKTNILEVTTIDEEETCKVDDCDDFIGGPAIRSGFPDKLAPWDKKPEPLVPRQVKQVDESTY